MKYDVLIIGAGVSGLMTAIELAESGVSCCILDKGKAGQESSWAGGGILSPLYPWRYPDAVNALATWGIQRYPDYLSRLYEQTGVDPEHLPCGHLIFDSNLPKNEIGDWAERYNQPVEWIDQATLREIEPVLSGQFTKGLWLPKIGQVRNPRLVQALLAYAKQLGVAIQTDSPAKAIHLSANRVDTVHTATSNYSANHVVMAAGAWSGLSIIPGISFPPIKPIKGQMIQFQTDPGTIHRISLLNDHYVIPRRDGKVLTGSTLEDTGFDKSTDEESALELKTAAIELFPALQDAPVINQWAGLRPGNDRLVPYIGRHPGIDNLYFNTGHFRNGIILGIASARLCSDLLLDKEPILDASPYALS